MDYLLPEEGVGDCDEDGDFEWLGGFEDSDFVIFGVFGVYFSYVEELALFE